MSARALFLHGGPGMHAGVERCWFGDTLHMHWWDQPSAKASDAAPFADAVSAALRQLSTMFAEQGEPTRVIAHSFGVLVARVLAREAPDLIESLTLLAPIRNVFRALRRLVARLPRQPIASSGAGLAGDTPNSIPSRERFLEFIQQLLTVDSLFDYYWGIESVVARDRYKQLSRDMPIFDLESFLAVAFDSLRESDRGNGPSCKLPTRIVVGRYDPLFDEADLLSWQTEFPELTIAWFDCGHWVHFELTPSQWMQQPGLSETRGADAS